MITKIMGFLWLCLGLLWLIKPVMLKNRLTRKMNKTMKRFVYFFIIIFGFTLIGSIVRTEGVMNKIVGIVGIIIVVKAMLLFTGKASEKMISWWTGKPLIMFRIWGLFVFLTGAALVFMR